MNLACVLTDVDYVKYISSLELDTNILLCVPTTNGFFSTLTHIINVLCSLYDHNSTESLLHGIEDYVAAGVVEYKSFVDYFFPSSAKGAVTYISAQVLDYDGGLNK